jgi:hypothetical protein
LNPFFTKASLRPNSTQLSCCSGLIRPELLVGAQKNKIAIAQEAFLDLQSGLFVRALSEPNDLSNSGFDAISFKGLIL